MDSDDIVVESESARRGAFKPSDVTWQGGVLWKSNAIGIEHASLV